MDDFVLMLRGGMVFAGFASLVMCILKRKDYVKALMYETAMFLFFLLNEIIGIWTHTVELDVINGIFMVLAVIIILNNYRKLQQFGGGKK